MKSNYKQYKWDGYSWRYRENTYDISDLKMSKEKLLWKFYHIYVSGIDTHTSLQPCKAMLLRLQHVFQVAVRT